MRENPCYNRLGETQPRARRAKSRPVYYLGLALWRTRTSIHHLDLPLWRRKALKKKNKILNENDSQNENDSHLHLGI